MLPNPIAPLSEGVESDCAPSLKCGDRRSILGTLDTACRDLTLCSWETTGAMSKQPDNATQTRPGADDAPAIRHPLEADDATGPLADMT